MRARCYNPNNGKYHIYGARGITVCDEWLGHGGIDNFRAWAVNHPTFDPSNKSLSIDRFPDTSGPYAPWNCRWATPKQQSRNLRKNVRYLYQGEMRTAGEIAELSGTTVSPHTVKGRLTRGLSVEQAIDPNYKRCRKGLRTRKFYTSGGPPRAGTLRAELAEHNPYNLDYFTVDARIRRGWSYEKAINTPLTKIGARGKRRVKA